LSSSLIRTGKLSAPLFRPFSTLGNGWLLFSGDRQGSAPQWQQRGRLLVMAQTTSAFIRPQRFDRSRTGRSFQVPAPACRDVEARLKLHAREAVLKAIVAIDGDMKRLARASDACRRLMTIPAVGQLTALAFTAAIDDPKRFKRSRDIVPTSVLCPVLPVREGRLYRQHLQVR
jgi:transposase